MHRIEPIVHFTVKKLQASGKKNGIAGAQTQANSSKAHDSTLRLPRPNSRVILPVVRKNRRSVQSKPVDAALSYRKHWACACQETECRRRIASAAATFAHCPRHQSMPKQPGYRAAVAAAKTLARGCRTLLLKTHAHHRRRAAASALCHAAAAALAAAALVGGPVV